MSEPRHALAHHLKMAADRALAFAEDDASRMRFAYGWYTLHHRAIGRLKSLKNIKTTDGRAECLERAAGLLLRAAVWLRRSDDAD